MLSKLLKHEFKATSRVMWIIYVAVLLLSVGANISVRILDKMNSTILNVLAVVVLILWVTSLIASLVATVVLNIRRFQKNLLTDEGYLMFTLPVNVHQLVISKVIAAAVWMMASFVVAGLGVCLAMFNNEFIKLAMEVGGNMIAEINTRLALNLTLVVVELLLVAFVSCVSNALEFYSAMSIGHGFANHKGLWSVVAFFVQYVVIQCLSSGLLIAMGLSRGFDRINAIFLGMSSMQGFHLVILSSMAVSLILCAVFYILTVWNLKKRLNLA